MKFLSGRELQRVKTVAGLVSSSVSPGFVTRIKSIPHVSISTMSEAMSESVSENMELMLSHMAASSSNLLNIIGGGNNRENERDELPSTSMEAQPSFNRSVKKLSDQIKELAPKEEDKSKGILEIVRINIKYFMEDTLWGRLWINMMVVLSVLSCMLYIVLTYITTDNKSGTKSFVMFADLEIIISSMFLADWVLSLLKAENKTKFLLG